MSTAAAGRLSGRTALVTGAARRLGRATALALAEAGADVIVHYRSSASEAESAAGAIRKLGRRAWTVRADLSDPDEAASLIRRAGEQAGPIRVLVNSASIFPQSRAADLSAEALRENIQINAFAPLQLCRAFAAQDVEGAVVNFLDCRIVEHDRLHTGYHLSKRMLLDITRILALELAPRVRVNAVAPGPILPPPGWSDERFGKVAAANPLGTAGRVEDVTAAVLFLLESPFITGEVIFVDGGRHLEASLYG